MFDSTSFNYINVLTKAADASNRRKDIISNNLANVSTPGFKRKDLLGDKELDALFISDKNILFVLLVFIF